MVPLDRVFLAAMGACYAWQERRLLDPLPLENENADGRLLRREERKRDEREGHEGRW